MSLHPSPEGRCRWCGSAVYDDRSYLSLSLHLPSWLRPKRNRTKRTLNYSENSLLNPTTRNASTVVKEVLLMWIWLLDLSFVHRVVEFCESSSLLFLRLSQLDWAIFLTFFPSLLPQTWSKSTSESKVHIYDQFYSTRNRIFAGSGKRGEWIWKRLNVF